MDDTQLVEAYPEAANILAAAGWTPHDTWGVYTRWTLVMGSPAPGEFHVKDWGKNIHGDDYPDDPVGAAQWLVAKLSKAQLSTEASLDIPLAQIEEAGETSAHESDGETGEEAGHSEALAGSGWQDAEGSSGGRGVPTERAPELFQDADFIQAEPDLPELGQELAEEHPDEPAGSAFIFGDNLDQMRTAAIGLVMRAALARMPAWTDTDTARLSELRNFAMGVSEGRWADDAGSRAWLEELEARLRLRSQIVSCRDTKVEFLNEASREEVEGFDPDTGWPA